MAHAYALRPLPTIREILFPTDFSACSQSALSYACATAKRFAASLHLVHVIGPAPLVGSAGEPYSQYTDETAWRKLANLADSVRDKKFRCHTSIHRGAVSNVICRLISERYIDLIILGTHGRRGLQHLIIGSVAEQVLRSATCPVLTIGPSICKQPAAGGNFATAVFATSFSALPTKALRYALAVACAKNTALILLHATEQADADSTRQAESAIASIKEQLRNLLPNDLPVTIDAVVMRGSPAAAILQSAAAYEADLIMMGEHRGPSAATHLPWSVAHTVLHDAPCPVMTIGY